LALRVELVSPERILFTGEAEMVICHTIGGGDIAFLSGHAPFLGALDIGKVRIQLVGGGEEQVAVHGGFVEVSNDTVSILSDVAELASQIDVERARTAREAAEQSLREQHDADNEAALRRATLRIDIAAPA
jgi:F-type H+-transporting ATPase subunit epsilon